MTGEADPRRPASVAQVLKTRLKAWVKVPLVRLRIAQSVVRQTVLLLKKRHQTKLKVAFITLTESTWKLEPLLCLMESDPAFDTTVVVAPVLTLDAATSNAEFENTKDYFANREDGDPVLTLPRELDALEPDIVFMTNPHPLTLPEFYTLPLKNYLCCYVPYSQDVSRYEGNRAQYNQRFHNVMWRIFAPHDISKAVFKAVSVRKDRNVTVTGYPFCEELIAPTERLGGVWKEQKRNKQKIIWAPHHTIEDLSLPYSNFLEYAEDFVALSERHKEDVQWAFKPHPLLRSRLYEHTDWGKDRTDAYFNYWNDAEHCQLEDGYYVDLFHQSDAMVHDSGSFLAEYLYVNKPVLFLQRVDNIRDYFNEFGVAAFEACDHARDFAGVERFVCHVIEGKNPVSSQRVAFYREHAEPYFDMSPSQRIVNHIKGQFPNLAAD